MEITQGLHHRSTLCCHGSLWHYLSHPLSHRYLLCRMRYESRRIMRLSRAFFSGMLLSSPVLGPCPCFDDFSFSQKASPLFRLVFPCNRPCSFHPGLFDPDAGSQRQHCCFRAKGGCSLQIFLQIYVNHWYLFLLYFREESICFVKIVVPS